MILLQAVADGRAGGGTTHVLQLIEALRRQQPGIEVHLVSQSDSYALERARRLGAQVHGIDFSGGGRLNPFTFARVRRLVARLRPALIHAHGARAGLPLAAARGAAAPEARLLYTVHGYHFLAKRPGLRQLGAAAERFCSARADLTVFVCRHDLRIAERWGLLARRRRHLVIHNGIDGAAVPRAVPSPDGHLVAFLGRLCEPKNPLLLLDVLAHLPAAAGYRLLVVGGGPLEAEMRRRAVAMRLSDRIDFRGGLRRDEALEALRRADVLAMPSLWEGLPMAALEAMHMGVPVVAAAVGGIPELVEHGVTGVLVERHDPRLFAAAIRRLAEDAELRRAIVAGARRVAAERFSWSETSRAYLRLYREALGAGGGDPAGSAAA